MRVTFTANGKPVEADDVWEGESLLYVLRERVGLDAVLLPVRRVVGLGVEALDPDGQRAGG